MSWALLSVLEAADEVGNEEVNEYIYNSRQCAGIDLFDRGGEPGDELGLFAGFWFILAVLLLLLCCC